MDTEVFEGEGDPERVEWRISMADPVRASAANPTRRD